MRYILYGTQYIVKFFFPRMNPILPQKHRRYESHPSAKNVERVATPTQNAERVGHPDILPPMNPAAAIEKISPQRSR
jgi:hypothetical protein